MLLATPMSYYSCVFVLLLLISKVNNKQLTLVFYVCLLHCVIIFPDCLIPLIIINSVVLLSIVRSYNLLGCAKT